MNRIHGSIGTLPIECVNPRYQKYRVRWDFKPSYNEDGEQDGVTFYEAEITYPTEEKIKDVVLAGYNTIIDERIVNGFTWNDMPIWLSHENQFNYKAAYDLAVQMQGANLPITFKFGTTINPQYYVFNTVDELQDFYLSAMKYINDTLSAGWIEKDSIDWEPYKNIKD